MTHTTGHVLGWMVGSKASPSQLSLQGPGCNGGFWDIPEGGCGGSGGPGAIQGLWQHPLEAKYDLTEQRVYTVYFFWVVLTLSW